MGKGAELEEGKVFGGRGGARWGKVLGKREVRKEGGGALGVERGCFSCSNHNRSTMHTCTASGSRRGHVPTVSELCLRSSSSRAAMPRTSTAVSPRCCRLSTRSRVNRPADRTGGASMSYAE